jgi:hypothetical protein
VRPSSSVHYNQNKQNINKGRTPQKAPQTQDPSRLSSLVAAKVLTSAVLLLFDLVALNALATFLGGTPGGGPAGGDIAFGLDLFNLGYE